MLQPAYSHLMNSSDSINNFPTATKVTTDTFFLGTSPVISKNQIEYIGECIKEFMKDF